MKPFAELYTKLDSTTKTSRKIAHLREYFAQAPPADAAWAVYFLSGRKPKRLVLVRNLRAWCVEVSGTPEWLFDECYDVVGDLAETIALLLPPAERTTDEPLDAWVRQRLLPLKEQSEAEQREAILDAWRQMNRQQRFVWNKLLTGAFRVGVSQRLVVRALAELGGLEPAVIAQRLMGHWEPSGEFFEGLLAAETEDTDLSRPYPFCLAHPLESPVEELGDSGDWLAEWKWDGIRSQMIRRGDESYLWSRGEEPILERFPELEEDAARLPEGTVLDGEIVGWKEGRVLPFGKLQRRIGRKRIGKKLLAEVPAMFIAFDVLEHNGADLRAEPLRRRRALLDEVVGALPDDARLRASEVVEAETWDEYAQRRAEARERNVEGLMLKRLDSPYAVGRPRGLWWKWKVAPYTVDAVMIYAQPGHGRRANLYTDYTFGLWDDGRLVPFAKAYSGLTDKEIREVDRFIREHTLEKFGPVRAVKPELVFELAFENLRRSTRHKSGIAVRFPRIARWRRDKRPEEADTLEGIRRLLGEEE